MSRLTGSDAKNLMEAYTAIYAPQEEVELTEEQVQEDFENWVNSLVEEGHDLSDHTWEEMYEVYIEEQGRRMTTGQATAPISNASYQSRFARPMNAGTPQQTGRGTVVSRPQIGSLPSSARQVTQYPQGVSTGVGGGNAAASRQTPATRPAASAARPSARPAASAARPSARPATTSSNAPVPSRTSYAGATGVKPVGTPLPTNAVQPVAGAPAQPMSRMAQQAAELRKMRQASQQRQISQGGTPATPLVQSFDPFDIVMGHLIDEGYADSEEAALQIMANMSEEWRQSIVEGVVDSKTMTSDERRRKRNDEYRSENPTLPSGNPMGPNAQLMRQMAHAKRRGKKEKKD
jgi:hypothetical protein